MERSEADRQLRYAKGATLDDVEGLESFLLGRTARLAGAERGSDERQLARSVRAGLQQHVLTFQNSLPFVNSGGEGEAAARLQVRMAWNALWALVSPWQWHDAYDQDRWRSVKHWDSIDEDQFARRLNGEFAKNRLATNGDPSKD